MRRPSAIARRQELVNEDLIGCTTNDPAQQGRHDRDPPIIAGTRECGRTPAGEETEQARAEIEARGVEQLMPNPSGRMARREEVADLVAFVASERAGYLNGAHLRIDGGATDLAF